MRLVVGYAEERRKWIKAGKPLRPGGEIARIYMEECSPCQHFRRIGVRGQCKACGCFLHPSSKSVNKIAWATTRCPLPSPKWTEWSDTAKS